MMNTRIVMSLSAILLGTSGMALTFAPDVVARALTSEDNRTTELILQIMGALYFAFAMLNWMSKGNLIGGIYNRPIAIANFTHFLIAGLALAKWWKVNTTTSSVISIATIFYIVLAILFGVMMFTHPIKENPNA